MTAVADISTWNAMAVALPGTVNMGPIVSYLVLFVPFVLFGAQGIYARKLFNDKKASISIFYSTLILLNVAGMALVTAPSALNGLVTGYARKDDPTSYPPTALGIWGLTNFVYGVHSVNNCCRVIFDSRGLRVAILFIPVAFMLQAWIIIALLFGFNPYSSFMIGAFIDYIQHLSGLVYWLRKISKEDSEQVDKARAWFGVGGVFSHMISVVPVITYKMDVPLEDQTTGANLGLLAFMVVVMIISQVFWIKMALCTPPGEEIFLDANKEKQQTKQEYKAQSTDDDIKTPLNSIDRNEAC
mmetsp:Transcript_12152/g.18365  ORF Transcript_12152/g.18365 Transcript_12152/m.18365 type:complete len:299 (+) Transcript_12152:146-1042(+)